MSNDRVRTGGMFQVKADALDSALERAKDKQATRAVFYEDGLYHHMKYRAGDVRKLSFLARATPGGELIFKKKNGDV